MHARYFDIYIIKFLRLLLVFVILVTLYYWLIISLVHDNDIKYNGPTIWDPRGPHAGRSVPGAPRWQKTSLLQGPQPWHMDYGTCGIADPVSFIEATCQDATLNYLD